MDCIFCKIAKNEMDRKLLYEDDLVVAVMDAFPNVDGHTLIIPKEHYTDYTELPDDLILHMYKVAKDLNKILMEKLNVNSITMLVNYGEMQAVKHFHLHLLPNYGLSKAKEDPQVIFEQLKK